VLWVTLPKKRAWDICPTFPHLSHDPAPRKPASFLVLSTLRLPIYINKKIKKFIYRPSVHLDNFFPLDLPPPVYTSKMVDILTHTPQTQHPYEENASTTSGQFRNCWTFFKGQNMDYVTRYPDKLDGAYCSACHTLKPIADFKRRATLSESRNWTKNPNLKRPIEYEGKHCNDCHRRRKPSELSPEELRRRLRSEERNPLKIQAAVEQRYAKGKASRKQKQVKAKQEKYAEQYNTLLTELANKIRIQSEHIRYLRRANKNAEYIEHQELVLADLRQQRDQLKEARRNGRDPTSLGNVTQNPAVPLSTSKGE